MSEVIVKKISILFSVFLFVCQSSIFAQIGNNNGQYDDVIKEAYSILDLIQKSDRKAIKQKFYESNFQTKKEFLKNCKTVNLKWVGQLLKQNGIPKQEDLMLSGWKTVSKDITETSFTVNVLFFLTDDKNVNKNNRDHVSINFIKSKNGIYTMNGLLIFKKNDLVKVKNIEDSSSK